MDRDELDEALGITRCAQCGHRLDGEIECPVCSGFYQRPARKGAVPKWIYFTACFLTSPFSIYFIIKSKRLNWPAKILAASGGLIWAYIFLF